MKWHVICKPLLIDNVNGFVVIPEILLISCSIFVSYANVVPEKAFLLSKLAILTSMSSFTFISSWISILIKSNVKEPKLSFIVPSLNVSPLFIKIDSNFSLDISQFNLLFSILLLSTMV